MAQNCLAVKNGLFRGVLLVNLFVLSALQPHSRVLWLTFMADFEIESRARLPTAFSCCGNDFAAIHPAANISEQGLVVSVKAQVAIAMVKNYQQTKPSEPL